MKHLLLYTSLIFSTFGTAVGAEVAAGFCDQIDALVTALVATDPNPRYIKKIEDLENNNGIEGLIAFKQRSSDGTKCPFCLDGCTLQELSDHVETDCTSSVLSGGHLCCVIPANDGQPTGTHYCFNEEDTLTKIKSALTSHNLATFIHWCAPEED